MSFERLDRSCQLLDKNLGNINIIEQASASGTCLERISIIFDLVSECVRDNEKALQHDFGIGLYLQ